MARRAAGWTLRKHSSGYYYVRFTHQTQRFDRSTGCRRKREAQARAAQIYADVIAGRIQQRPAGDLDELIPEWLTDVTDTRSDEWATTCELYANRHWPWSDLAEITSASVQAYIRRRLRTVAASTVRKELSALRRFLLWCHSRGDLEAVPTWQTPNAKSDYQAEYLERDEMDALLAELPDRTTHPRHFPVREYYTVMWATSFRKATMAAIRWEDVDLEAGTVAVRPSADKRQFDRPVPLTAAAVAALDSLPKPRIGLVFGKRDYRASLRSAAERAGITKHLTPNHSVRHSRLSDFASRSKNVAAIQHMAGHKDLASTMRYVHSSLDNARALLDEVEEGE